MMLRALAIAAAACTLAAPAAAQGSFADSTEVRQFLERRADAMRRMRAEPQRANYAPGAVWINAFGVRRTGPDSIVAYLERLYANAGFQESQVEDEPLPEFIFVRPDVAIVHEFRARAGQRVENGMRIDRRTHTTLVLSKEDGRWLIRYQYIGDERPRVPPQ